jgi:hypothetical protein
MSRRCPGDVGIVQIAGLPFLITEIREVYGPYHSCREIAFSPSSGREVTLGEACGV